MQLVRKLQAMIRRLFRPDPQYVNEELQRYYVVGRGRPPDAFEVPLEGHPLSDLVQHPERQANLIT